MTPERWEQISNIFELVLEAAPGDREAVLAAACGEDVDKRAAVERLLHNHGDLGSFLEDPIAEAVLRAPRTAAFHPGDRIAGKFRINALLGSGGMGDVYEAHDIELDEAVALKTIRADWARDASSLARFRQETQLLRRITHPNVCRIFDLYRHGDTLLFSMEFLRGDTLAQRLSRAGRLDPASVLRFGGQIAEGLDAAHALGIVHRDLKPSNVMLVASRDGGERAVIMDFGLARFVDEASRYVSRAVTGPAIGTPAYMAPEQFESSQASAAADVYAFGLILFEMLTGAQAARTKSRTLREIVPELSRDWETAIARCLEPDPSRRFSRASEAIEAASGTRIRVPRPSRRMILIASGAGAMALFAAFLRSKYRERHFQRGATVLMTEIRNGTRDPDLDSVTRVLRSQLGQSAYFQLLDEDETRAALHRMVRPKESEMDAVTARELAMRENLPAVIFGAIDQVGPDYVLQVRVEAVGSHPSSPAASSKKDFSCGSKRELFGAISDAASWIRQSVGEEASEISDRNRIPQEITTPSWDALRLYTQATRLRTEGRNADAVPLLQESLRQDPDFALAAMSLADLLIQTARYDEGYALWRTAAKSVERRSLGTREALRIRSLYANDTGDYATARRLFELYAVQFPSDYLPLFYLAGALEKAGKFEAALVPLERAAQLNPVSAAVQVHLALTNLTLRRWDEVRKHSERVLALGDKGWSAFLNGITLAAAEQFDNAAASFQALGNLAEAEWTSRGYALRACIAAERGHVDDALQLLSDGIAVDRRFNLAGAEADKNVARGYILLQTAEFKGVQAAVEACLALDHSPNRVMQAGTLLARAGFGGDARRALELLPAANGLPIYGVLRDRLEGEIEIAAGNARGGIARLERASKAESALIPKDYLAHGYLRAGQTPEAANLYRQIAASRALVWRSPDRFPPGLCAEAAALAKKLSNS